MGQATESAGKSIIEVDLLSDALVPEGLKPTKPMELSLSGLRETLSQVLESEQFHIGDLAEGQMMFEFRADFSHY